MVVDGLEMVEIDLEEADWPARASDPGTDRDEVLLELHPVADPGQLVGPGRDLEGPIDPLELDPLAVLTPVESGDRLHLAEGADVVAEQEHVADEAGDKRDDHRHDEIAPVAQRQGDRRDGREEHCPGGGVGGQPADLGPGPPRDHQGHERRQEHQVGDRQVDELRPAEGHRHHAEQDRQSDRERDELGPLAQSMTEGPPRRQGQAAERGVHHQEEAGMGRMKQRQGEDVERRGGGHDEHRRPGSSPGPSALGCQEPPAPADRVVLLRLDELDDPAQAGTGIVHVDDHRRHLAAPRGASDMT